MFFQICTSLIDGYHNVKNYMLMLADTENEKSKWVMALNELHRILKRNNLPNTMVSGFDLTSLVNTSDHGSMFLLLV